MIINRNFRLITQVVIRDFRTTNKKAQITPEVNHLVGINELVQLIINQNINEI